MCADLFHSSLHLVQYLHHIFHTSAFPSHRYHRSLAAPQGQKGGHTRGTSKSLKIEKADIMNIQGEGDSLQSIHNTWLNR